MITAQPALENRPEQPYVGIRTKVTMAEIGSKLPPLHQEIVHWLEKQSLTPSGAPFFRYIVIDMENQLDMEVGFPVASPLAGEGHIQAGLLPAGSYATLTHTGHFKGLYHATGELLDWAKKNNIVWATTQEGKDEIWEARLEIYLSDDDPNPEKWVTELAFLVASS
jgi:effector-binding domain-containing protein